MTDSVHILLSGCVEPDDFVFTWQDRRPLRDFRGTCAKFATRLAFRPLLFHDLRRSAVRNMVRRGVPQKTARTISGHKTDAVFSRYNIVSGADIADAARKIEEGAKAAVSGSIHSSFIVGPENESVSDEQKGRKPF